MLDRQKRKIRLSVIVLGATRAYFNLAVENLYEKDTVLARMHLLLNPSLSVVRKEIPEELKTFDHRKPVLERIRESGVLKVGYHPDNLPFSYFNMAGELVGFDRRSICPK
jgi:hypothetical protein